LQALPKLESSGIRDGYADYWDAYRLDFLSAGRLHLTVAGNDPDRWVTLNNEVIGAASNAWIFVTAPPATRDPFPQFPVASGVGPGGLTESQFIADLHRGDIHYRIVTSGFIQAVVPDHRVMPAEVGLP
jgi:hypothetical protein